MIYRVVYRGYQQRMCRVVYTAYPTPWYMEWCIYLILTEDSTRNNKPVRRLTRYLKYQIIRMLYWKNMKNQLKVNPMTKTEWENCVTESSVMTSSKMSAENKREGQIRLGTRWYNSWRIWISEKSWKHGKTFDWTAICRIIQIPDILWKENVLYFYDTWKYVLTKAKGWDNK